MVEFLTVGRDKEITVTCRNPILRKLSTSINQTLQEDVAILHSRSFILTRNILKCLASTRIFKISIIRDVLRHTRGSLSTRVSKFIDRGTVESLSKSFTKLLRVFRTDIIVIHCIIDIRDKSISREETIDSNHSLRVLHLLTLII